MSPITHFLLSWLIADRAVEGNRDKGLIAAAGVLPDLDGGGAFVDLCNHWMGRPESNYFAAGHHWWAHGLPGCLAIAVFMALYARERGQVFLYCMLTTHLHLICDLLGSRDPESSGLWSIFYLGPLSRQCELIWRWQWRLDSWQNVAITLVLLILTFRTAWRYNRSPLSLLSLQLHRIFVDTLRNRWGIPREESRD